MKMQDQLAGLENAGHEKREKLLYGTPSVAYVCPLPSRTA